MKKFMLSILAVSSMAAVCAVAQTPQYVDARELRIINKGFDDTTGPYTRLPAAMEDSVRSRLWYGALSSAGIGVRFATNSSKIGVRYDLLRDFHMLHMADTGTKGTDIYVFEGDSVWRHANTIRPGVKDKETKTVEGEYMSNLDTTRMTEYMIYMPLYDGVTRFEVKVDSGAAITPGRADLLRPKGRIVAYGTSILQGGCASRPGMCATNIISRELDREVINLGFSGEGKMDFCMARAMAKIPDVDLFLIDPVPNCTQMMCDTLTYDFVKILREARPGVPIVMVEGPIFPYARYDSFMGSYLPAKNVEFRKNYDRLKAENPENLYYVDSFELDGAEDDGTVDGIHLTDLGFRHYADKLVPVLKTVLGKERQSR